MPAFRGPGIDTVIDESHAGEATNRICFPGIDSCVVVLAVCPTKLIGTHLTVLDTKDQINALLDQMLAAGGGGSTNVYVAGPFRRNFKPHTAASSFNTRKKIRDRIRNKLGKQPGISFLDTDILGGFPKHLLFSRNGATADFSWTDSGGGGDRPSIHVGIPPDLEFQAYAITNFVRR